MQNGYKKLAEAAAEFKSFRGRRQREKVGRAAQRVAVQADVGNHKGKQASIVELSQASGLSQRALQAARQGEVHASHRDAACPETKKQMG